MTTEDAPEEAPEAFPVPRLRRRDGSQWMKRLPVVPPERLPAVIESILFVADEAVELGVLVKALHHSKSQIEKALVSLEERVAETGTRLQRTGDLVQLVTAPDSGPYVERYLGLESRMRLSGAALESLAVIAYRQPTTRASVESVRGVNSDAAIASLIGRGLVEEVGRAPGPGRPILLGTTLRFLEHFGLTNPADLPPLPDAATNGDTPSLQGKLDVDEDAYAEEDAEPEREEETIDAG